MKKLLLTGFEPFGGEKINPALEAVRSVKDEIGGLQVVKLQVPVVFCEADRLIRSEMERLQPDAVMCVGQAGGRDAITPERVAINVMDAVAADNAGNVMTDCAVAADGPAAYFATLPVKDMIAAVQSQGIACRISNTAGTYVCNNVMYGALHYAAQHMPHTLAGFVHVPYIPEQTVGKENVPSMPLKQIVQALEAMIGVIAEKIV